MQDVAGRKADTERKVRTTEEVPVVLFLQSDALPLERLVPAAPDPMTAG